MLRRAGFVCRSCIAAYTAQLQWLVEARAPSVVRHSSTSSTGHAGVAPGHYVDTPRTAHLTLGARNESLGFLGENRSPFPRLYPPRGPVGHVRFQKSAKVLRVQSEETRQRPETVIKRYHDWDRQFQIYWRNMVRRRPVVRRRKTGGSAQHLKKLLRAKSVDEMRRVWQAYPKRRRFLNWSHVMLACLHYYPDRAAEVLEATVDPEHAPPYAVADVLGFLVQYASGLPEERRSAQRAALPGLLLHLLRCSPPSTFRFRSQVISNVVAACGDPQMLFELYSELQQYRHPLDANTRLRFANALAKDVRYKLAALRILDELVKTPDHDVNDPRFRGTVVSLLTLPMADRNAPRTSALHPRSLDRLQARLFEGVSRWEHFTPDVVIYEVLIRNLCQNNGLAAAWEIYDLMRDQGIEPNAVVFSTLLNGSKYAGDIESASRVISEAPQEVLRDPFIYNDLLHTILMFSLGDLEERMEFQFLDRRRQRGIHHTHQAFPLMLHLYARFFKLQPLQKLVPFDLSHMLARDVWGTRLEGLGWKSWMASIVEKMPALEPGELLEPETATLRIMVISYIKSLPDAYSIIAFYSRFRSLLKAGDEDATALVRLGSRVHDVIIKAIIGRRTMLRVGLSILEDMLRDAAARQAGVNAGAAADGETTGESSSSSSAPIHPEPSVFTWNVVLDGFLRQPQQDVKLQSARILQMMRQHGVEPCKVTWTTMLAGFARWQIPTLAASTLSTMQELGYRVEKHQRRAVSLLRDRALAGEILGMADEVERRRDEQEASADRLMDENERNALSLAPGLADEAENEGADKMPREREGTAAAQQPASSKDQGSSSQLAAAMSAVEEAAAALLETKQRLAPRSGHTPPTGPPPETDEETWQRWAESGSDPSAGDEIGYDNEKW